MEDKFFAQYEKELNHYLNQGPSTEQIHQSAQEWIKSGVSPELVISSHLEVMRKNFTLSAEWDKSFSFLLEIMSDYGNALNERLELMRSRNQWIEELKMAATVQQSLLPDPKSLTLPDGVDIGVVSLPARRVSGDFYNVFAEGNRIKFAVADVSGKSMPAAIFMSMVKFAMDELIEAYQRPHMALTSLNRFIHRNSDSSMFVTMFWAEYDLANHRFYYSSAGHEPALFYSAERNKFYDLSTDGAALGLSTRFSFKTENVHLAAGDFVLLYTDGIIERRDSAQIDDSKILRQFLREIDLSQGAQPIVDQLHQRILELNGFKRHDDQTIFLFRRKK